MPLSPAAASVPLCRSVQGEAWSPRRVPGNPVPVPVLSARRGRSSVLPVRPDGTGGSSRRRRPERASPACGAQSRPASLLCRCSPAAASVPLLPISRALTGAGRWRSVPGLSASAGPIFDADAVSLRGAAFGLLGAAVSVCAFFLFHSEQMAKPSCSSCSNSSGENRRTKTMACGFIGDIWGRSGDIWGR